MDLQTLQRLFEKMGLQKAIGSNGPALMQIHYNELRRNQDYLHNAYANAYGTPSIPQTTNDYHSKGLQDMFAGHFGGADSNASQIGQAVGMGGAALMSSLMPPFALRGLMNPDIGLPTNINEIIKNGKDFADSGKVLQKIFGDNMMYGMPQRIMNRLGETNTISKIMEQFIGRLPHP